VRVVRLISLKLTLQLYYIEKVGNSVIIKGTSDRDWIYISSESKEELQIIKGKLPFVHIEEKNEKSMKSAVSLGFKKDRVVNWFEIE